MLGLFLTDCLWFQAPQPCKGAPTMLKVVTVYLSVAAAGTVTVDVDSSVQTL